MKKYHSQEEYNSEEELANFRKIIETYEEKVSDKTKLLTAKTVYGHIALIEFCYSNNFKAIEYIIEKHKGYGGNLKELLNAKSKDGETPLLLLCKKGNLEAIQYIVETYKNAGGNLKELLNAKSNKGYTPLFELCKKGNLEAIKYFVETYENAGGGNLKELVNAKSDFGEAPLIELCFRSNFEAFEYIIEKYKEHGGDVKGILTDKLYNGDNLLLYWSRCAGKIEGIKYILETYKNAGGDLTDILSAKSEDGHTPLTMLSPHESLEGIKYFLEHGADLTDILANDNLFASSSSSGFKTIEYLLSNNFDYYKYRTPNKEQNTIFDLILLYRSKEQSKKLLDFCAEQGILPEFNNSYLQELMYIENSLIDKVPPTLIAKYEGIMQKEGLKNPTEIQIPGDILEQILNGDISGVAQALKDELSNILKVWWHFSIHGFMHYGAAALKELLDIAQNLPVSDSNEVTDLIGHVDNES